MPPNELLPLEGPVGLKTLDKTEKRKKLELEQPLAITEGEEPREGRGNKMGLQIENQTIPAIQYQGKSSQAGQTKSRDFVSDIEKTPKKKFKSSNIDSKSQGKQLFVDEGSHHSRPTTKKSATGGSKKDPIPSTARRASSGVSSRTRSRSITSLLSFSRRGDESHSVGGNQQGDQNIAYVGKEGGTEANGPVFVEPCEKGNPWEGKEWVTDSNSEIFVETCKEKTHLATWNAKTGLVNWPIMLITEEKKMYNTKGYKAMELTSQVTLNEKIIKEGWSLRKPGVYHYGKFNEFAILLHNKNIQPFLLQRLAGRLGVVKLISTVGSREFMRMAAPDPQQYPTLQEAAQIRGKGSGRGFRCFSS